jgi:hypothetical protein
MLAISFRLPANKGLVFRSFPVPLLDRGEWNDRFTAHTLAGGDHAHITEFSNFHHGGGTGLAPIEVGRVPPAEFEFPILLPWTLGAISATVFFRSVLRTRL